MAEGACVVNNDEAVVRLHSLADEIIESIFILESLSYRDICRLSCTCRRFNVIANGKEIWRRKSWQRWGTWKHLPEANANWKDVFKRRIKCENDLTKGISKIIKDSYNKECLQNKDLKSFAEYYDAQDKDSVVHIDNTFAAIFATDRFKELTVKYYARKIYIYIRQHELKIKWCALLCKNERPSDLIEGAILISQWCNPFEAIDKDSILKKINEIAVQVKDKLENNETESSDDIIKILEAIRVVLFEEHRFHGNSRFYYDVDNSFIDKVLEHRTGIPITLSIVFAAIAERLGVYLEPVNFPNHFLLRYRSSRDNHQNDVYIDAFNGGKILNEQECLHILPPQSVDSVPREALFPIATAKQVFKRMVANIVRCHRASTSIDTSSLVKLRGSLELLLLLSPDDEDHRLMLSRVYLHHGIHLDEVIENLRQLSSSTRGNIQTGLLANLLESAMLRQDDEAVTNVTPKYRTDPQNAEVQYRVGMVMHHRRYHYFCVIYGWDYFCNMEEGWRNQMGIYNLAGGAEQAFYHVLVDDGSNRYAAEENLAPLLKNGRPISHPHVGRYFNEFDGFRYIPNEFLDESFPEDGNIPNELLPADRYNPENEDVMEQVPP